MSGQKENIAGMADGSLYPSAFVVDSYANAPPLPPRLGRVRQRAGVAQTLLFLLVSLALCGMTIQACLLYHLYQSRPVDSASFAKLTSDKDDPAQTLPLEVHPSKPAAHLTDGYNLTHQRQIMNWSTVPDPLLYEMGYEDTKLFVKKEGYYYVYSKVSFHTDGRFIHSVHMETKRYPGGNIPLLQATSSTKRGLQSNSYLGGVFHLYKDDALYVKVSNTKQIARAHACENVFGAYMI